MKKLTIFFFIFVLFFFCSTCLFGQIGKEAVKIKYESRIEQYKGKGENLSPPVRIGNLIMSYQTGQWDQPSTWVGGIVPTSNDDVEIKPNHIVTIDTTNQFCKNIDIDSSGKIIIMPGIRFYVFGDMTNNGIINGTADSCGIQFCGSNSQIFQNKGTIMVPLRNLNLSNPNGLSISSTTGQITVLRVNLFWGTITNSGVLTIGNGGTSYGTVQRGAEGSPYPAGSFDARPAFNVGAGGLNLLYTVSSTTITTQYEVPSTGNVNYIFTNFVTNMGSNINVMDSIDLAATTFSIGCYTLTLNNRIFYSGGILSGGTSSNLVINGTNPLSLQVFNGLNNLTINNPGGVTLDTNLTIKGTLTLTSGQLINRSFLTMGNYESTSIVKALGSLSSPPTFGTYINLTYSSSGTVYSNYEMPTSSSTLKNLTINNSTTLKQSQTPGPITEVLSLESFEGTTFPPTGWSNTRITGNVDWIRNNGDHNYGGGANSTTYNALLFSNAKGTKTDLITKSFSCSNASTATLTFYHKQTVWNGDQDSLALYVSSNGGSSWTRIFTYQNSERNWSYRSWNLENYVTLTSNMKIKFHGCAEYGYGVCIDEVKITKTGVSTPSTVTVNGTLTLSNGIYNIGSNALVLNGSVSKSGSSSITGSSSSNLTIGGSGSSTTLPPINYGLYNFTIDRENGVTLSSSLSTNSLTLTSGKIITTSSNLLTVTGTTTSSVQVTNGYVKGPLAVTLPPSLALGYTYQLPVGKSTSNLLELINPTTTTGGTVVIKAEVFDGKTNGICGNQIFSLDSTRYWTLNVVSGAGNFSTTRVRVTYPGITTDKAIAISTTALAGTYHYIGRLIDDVTIRTQNYINITTSNIYFAIGTADNNYGTGSPYSGYECFANSTMSGVSHPDYNWYDPVALGHTSINYWQWSGTADDGYYRIPNIGFPFTFYGNTYQSNNIYIGTNGYITFGSGSRRYSFGDMLPTTDGAPTNMIAGCFTDLDLKSYWYSDAKVYYGGDNSSYFVVTFIHAHAYGQDDDYVTFQIVLFANGNFRIQYDYSGYKHQGSTDIENSCNIGMNNDNGTLGMQYRYNGIGGPMFLQSNNPVSNIALEFGSDLNSLPVELASFNSIISGRDVKLNWTTTRELNNSGFDILRKKTDEKSWNKIGFIKGYGTSMSLKEYSFYDNNLKTGKYNYCLKQIDYNGNTKLFELKNDISVGIPTKFSLSQNFPNPFNASTKIRFDVCKICNVTLKIYDITGREIKTLINEKLNPDYYEVLWNATNIASGAYFVRIIAGDFSDTKKMVLLK